MDFMLTDTERQLATERQLKYQGTAKIDLNEISLHPSVDRKVDQKNVERLYISHDLRNALVDEYANEKRPTDGEVYRKIRQYQHESNALFQNRWWSRLSPNKAKRLRQLFSQENTFICAAFDALLPIPGLWNGMSLGSLNSVFALKCDEEIIHYLGGIWTFWAALVNHDRTWMARIDPYTVDMLQLHAPRASEVDQTTVEGRILSGEVFSNFTRSERTSIWANLQSHEACDGIIPSLHTFFRDISYLELCANAVKRLVVLNKQHPTVRSALVHSFRPRHGDGDYPVQTSETTFRRQRGATAEGITSGYRQIWMYAMRHYPDMAKDVQCGHRKANPARAKARAKADESVIHDMAALARKLGFRTPQIKEILKQSPDRQIARASLLKARKPDRYHYDSETFESLVDRIVGCFALAIPNESQPTMALVTGQAPKLNDRCGAPQEQNQQLDRPHLFLDRLHVETVRQRNLSSLEVRRCVYYAFFGKPTSATTTQSTMLGHSPESEPPSPLFLPNDDSPVEFESVEEITSRRSLNGGSVHGHSDRSESRRERRRKSEERRQRRRKSEERRQRRRKREERRQRRRKREERRQRRQERQHPSHQAAVHTPSPPGEPLPRISTGEGSTVGERITMDSWESSDWEDLEPQQGMQSNVEMEEQECTELDGDELDREEQKRAEQELSPRISTGEGSTVSERITMDIWESSDSKHLEPQPGRQPDVEMEERECTGLDDELVREEQKRAEQERTRREAQEQIENERPEREAAETEQGRLAQEELLEGESQRHNTKHGALVAQQEGSERATATKASLADHQVRTAEAPVAHAATAEEVEILLDEMLQGKAGSGAASQDASITEEQVFLERADALARLQSKAEAIPSSVGAVADHTVSRPITEMPVDLPTLLARWRERWSQLDDESTPLSGSRRLATRRRQSKPAGLRKSRMKGTPTHQDINRLGAREGSPENAQKEAVERQAAEESLFDDRYSLVAEDQTIEEAQEDETPVIVPSKRRRPSSLRPEQVVQIRVREIKAVRESKRSKQTQVGESGTPEALQVDLASRPDNRLENPAPLAPERTDGDLPSDVSPGRRVRITFYAYEGGSWTKTDTVSVSSNNPTEAQSIADRYAREQGKNARFYDRKLRKVAADESVRAAIADGSFTIFMSFGRNLHVTRHLSASFAQLLQNIRNDGQAIEDSIL
ncbi:hypothetical protein CNMCM5793_004950 [Aspergillus hiratsukae]|uniref:Uncharacterized protein n=1 Tax=Aspergillus hiratsukae TaxID=1194566 RepID=A0A8H6UGP3_9EURO|nr:hypothetical protein CNMCM5793_004950 [Aspergillus hiratsukae]KAF7172887.1 hypothetical protein CNMCM6106_007063 [Aspergillus hiratsukae]